ncbi:ADP-ribosylglycohydrolase family protein [Nonomuraea angiospora]|uniref:ADP-ribosylglycohydrolase family protein n=1 Tax=Nonomuraea angiospora TaxID=46172 RepID=UPI003792CE59
MASWEVGDLPTYFTMKVMSAQLLARAAASLHGLALGDAFGSQFFLPTNRHALSSRLPPPSPWQWTDDTEMACSVYRVLADHGTIDQDELAASFATRHDFDRGYGPATNRMLRLVREGGDWRALSAELFDGKGSWGNGAAMRVAPLGAWFADDLTQVVRQAVLSAQVTHTHPEAVARGGHVDHGGGRRGRRHHVRHRRRHHRRFREESPSAALERKMRATTGLGRRPTTRP